MTRLPLRGHHAGHETGHMRKNVADICDQYGMPVMELLPLRTREMKRL
jgi:hypothetical protein